MSDQPSGEKRGFQLNNTVLIGGLFVIAAALAVQEFMVGDGLEKGTQAPEVSLWRLDGTRVGLGSLQSKVVLLNFWATWCPPCVEELPELVEVAKAYEGRVVFVAANVEEHDDAVESVPMWLRQHPQAAPYVLLASNGGSADAVSEAFLVQALPTTYVLGPDGKVLASARGQVTGAQVRGWLDAALSR
jgi:thiol-disulfide isomerase/thioredoxin